MRIHNRIFRRRILFLATVFFIAAALTILGHTIASAKESEVPLRIKCYKSILIEEGDSLWTIAGKYMTLEYSSTQEYVNELISMNGLSGDTIHAGSYLVVAYYTENPDAVIHIAK